MLPYSAEAYYKVKLMWNVTPNATGYYVYVSTRSLIGKTTTQATSNENNWKYQIAPSTNAITEDFWFDGGTTYYIRSSVKYLVSESSFTKTNGKDEIVAWKPKYKFMVHYLYKDKIKPTNVSGLVGVKNGIEPFIPISPSTFTYYGQSRYEMFVATGDVTGYMVNKSTQDCFGMKLYSLDEISIMDFKNMPGNWFTDYVR
jgi:hypothetical protein